MKKSLFIAAFAVFALTSCSNTEDEIFDESAPVRLEQYKKEYAEVLTAEGGLWSMEYFANPDEPGYVFVMKFSKDGSVTISANHKWIDNRFKQETSVWKMIADNGPVLSFNSYNSVFHIFSDPANISGPNAPVGDDGQSDVDETGFGHEGDYEFQFMSVSDDGQSVRLLGKKRMYSIYMHRLAPDTDPEQYLNEVSNVAKTRFSSKFNEMEMVDADGNHFRLYNLYTAIPSIYPIEGDEVMQTVSGNGIITLQGFRFMAPLEVARADGSTIELNELYFNEAGALSGENVTDVRSISPLQNVMRNDMTWKIDPESLSGKVKSLYDAANAEIVSKMSAKDKLGDIDLTYGIVSGKSVAQFVTRIGSRICRNYIDYAVEYSENLSASGKQIVVPSDQFHFSITGGNSTANKYDGELPAYKALKDYLCGHFTLTVNDPIVPDVITVTDNSDSSSKFNLIVK